MPIPMSQLIKTIESEPNYFLVIHPLDDIPEQKIDSDHLPPMEMTQGVRWSLISLRVYLIFMIALFMYHVIDLASQMLTKK
jgi:hypothetical protein